MCVCVCVQVRLLPSAPGRAGEVSGVTLRVTNLPAEVAFWQAAGMEVCVWGPAPGPPGEGGGEAVSAPQSDGHGAVSGGGGGVTALVSLVTALFSLVTAPFSWVTALCF